MVEILKSGKQTKFSLLCPNCEAELVFHKADVITDEDSVGMEYEKKHAHPVFVKYNYIMCPCCGEQIFLGKGKIIPEKHTSKYENFFKRSTKFTMVE